MSIPAILLGSILVVVSILAVTNVRKKMTALKRYELDNRSPDGIVEFENIDISRAHTADKGLYTVLSIVGFFVGVFGIVLLIEGINL